MICKIENCDRKTVAKELCKKHYYFFRERKRKGIPPDWPYNKRYNTKYDYLCSMADCGQKTRVKGFCSFHYWRSRKGIPLDRPKGVKGELNHNWKGGIAHYPDQTTMKRNRKIKIEQQKGKCEICNRKGTRIHHKDGSRTNHLLENLKLLCTKCHGRVHRGRRAKTSIWIRRYGINAKDLGKKLNCSYETLVKWHKNGDIRYFLGK